MINKLKVWIEESDNIVFFGGAGVSTESNIPDFRSQDGLYNMEYKYPPETILSHTFFINNTGEFYRFYKNKMIYKYAKPNKAHYVLAELEDRGKLKAVITQNIDGLHQMAGSRNVIELHGSVLTNRCMKCGKKYSIDYIIESEDIPRCECGGTVKPEVVLYEESLNNDSINKAINYIYNADMLIVGGTSLKVYPAAGLIDYYRGNKLVLINKENSVVDNRADLVVQGKIGEILDAAI